MSGYRGNHRIRFYYGIRPWGFAVSADRRVVELFIGPYGMALSLMRKPGMRWLEPRRVCCDKPSCPYDQRRTEYAKYLGLCLWVGHKWSDMAGFQLCPRCRAERNVS